MKRNSLALAAGIALALGSSAVVTADASFVNTSAAAMLQGQATSRWQPDRFGPIVASDTLWSIAMYYGDQTDLSVYEMMDLFIELNPEAFINGRADRMMDGYYLKVPEVAQRARAETSDSNVVTAAASPTTTTSETPETESTTPAEPVKADIDVENTETSPETKESAADVTGSSVAFDVAELTQLRTQLAESISLIERLNTENNALQQRLDSVNAELEQLRLKVDAEQVAEDELQEQIAAEIVATKVEAGEAAATPPTTTVTEPTATTEEASTEAAPETAMETAAPTQSQPADTKVTEVKAPEPKAAEPKAAERQPVKRKQQSEYEAFLAWLLQPFQLTLAILIPLLLAAIIWYVLYVRRLNRETLGPYNGAMQAAEQEQQQEQDKDDKKLSAYDEAEQAAFAEDAADMPEFERLDDEEDEVVAQEADAEDSLEDDLTALDSSEDEFEAIDETVDDETDLDTLLASSFDDDAESASPSKEETTAEVEVEPEYEPEVEVEPTPQAESSDDDLSLEFDNTPEQEASKVETKAADSVSADDDEMSLDFHSDDATAEAADDLPAAPAVDKAPVTDLEVELEQFEDVDLDDIDLEALATEDATKPEADDDSDDAAFLEIDALLEEAEAADSDFESPRFERESGQVDDNEETPSSMIDLARAYLEMDEYELARTELEKVTQSDDEDAKREAAMLLQKIEEQGH
ncbi:MAG: hypothetical protein B7X54_05885 [Idiomarina sp. 34-48-12]|nr:MAG: hypothetical protein B7X54_05885 [Idiomarina sp. 34-48-12]